MSEPMSSVEIEDVLSSIRRLVSEDLRPAARGSGVPVPPRPAAPSEGSKLILTPALRVVPGQDEDAPAAEDVAVVAPEAVPVEASEDEADAWDAPAFHSVRHDAPAAGPAPTAADSVATLGAAMDDLPEAMEWEAEEAGFVEVDDLHAAEIVALDRFAPVDSAALSADVAEAMGAAVDAPHAAVDADWMPEEQASWDDAAPDLPAAEWPSGDMPADDPAGSGDAMTDAGLAEVIAQTVTEGAETAPQTAQVPDPAADSRTWADAAEAEVLRRLSEDTDDFAFAAGSAAAPDAIYDEELLRELVRDIIREELQGALGERITRNVRKLVRAEISRALAVRDFE